jgi:subtilisin family serine protease
MKKFFPLTVLLFVVGFAAGQVLSDDKIWVTFADTTTLLSSDKATTNTSINAILDEYDVTNIVPLFPFAKTPFLRHTYEVTTQKAELLYERISNEKGLFSLCERVPEAQLLYNPSDWMWYYTISNNITDDWLWYLVKIQAADAWDITKGDSTIRIAVVDDGFDYQHPELQSKINPPYDFYSGVQETTSNDHGTGVASILAAETANQGETAIGSMASIGYKSKIMVSQ